MRTRTACGRWLLTLSMFISLVACGDSSAPRSGEDSSDDRDESADPSSSRDDSDDDEKEEKEEEDELPSSTRKDGGSARLDAGSRTGDTRASDAATQSGPRSDASKQGSASDDAGVVAAPPAPEDAAVTSESPCPSNGDPCKVLPLGDSITFGIGYAGGYRVELFKRATLANQKLTFVGSVQNGPSMVESKAFPRRNEGHSGWTIEQIAGLVPMPALQDGADIVLLMAGTNDVNLRRDLANAPKRLGSLIDALAKADDHMLIVVAQLTPLSSNSAAIEAYNRALPALVQERAAQGKHVLLVDMNSGFPANALGDGVHPNQKGYEWMAGVWYEAIKGALR